MYGGSSPFVGLDTDSKIWFNSYFTFDDQIQKYNKKIVIDFWLPPQLDFFTFQINIVSSRLIQQKI